MPGTPFYILLTHLILTLQQSYEIGTFVIPSLQMMKLRHRVVKKLVHN